MRQLSTSEPDILVGRWLINFALPELFDQQQLPGGLPKEQLRQDKRFILQRHQNMPGQPPQYLAIIRRKPGAFIDLGSGCLYLPLNRETLQVGGQVQKAEVICMTDHTSSFFTINITELIII